ncbi:MAG: AAA family ATPase [Chloroflexi bacterium]|nr:AAA family ATPase [Chloroflexota bacterium]
MSDECGRHSSLITHHSLLELRNEELRRHITDDLDALIAALPPHIQEPLVGAVDRASLLEVVMDLGRQPEARYPGSEQILSQREVADDDLEYVVSRIGAFGDDNRAGIERTLHRISAIRNRRGRVVGLTLRVGRAVYGTIAIIQDIVQSGKSILMLGRPGVGKTTMLREMARVLADDLKKRVIIVDTSNEIGGDGDIPHPAIGHARRMQVVTPTLQHAVMIEAVENHMPEVIVIDEIGTELEAVAARTIAERGVQLIATAHGNTLENLMLNPTLSDLVGGIQTVTLSDEEARRRGTQKSILERKAPPTFDGVVEIQSWDKVAVHHSVADAVDGLLRGRPMLAQVREIDERGEVTMGEAKHPAAERPAAVAAGGRPSPAPAPHPVSAARGRTMRLYPYGISRNRLEQAIKELQVTAVLVRDLHEADAVMTARTYYRRKPPAVRDAESLNIPVYVLKSNAALHMQQSLASLFNMDVAPDEVSQALQETESAIERVRLGEQVELAPQNAYIRRLQHQMAEKYNLASRSRGKEPFRRVLITPP